MTIEANKLRKNIVNNEVTHNISNNLIGLTIEEASKFGDLIRITSIDKVNLRCEKNSNPYRRNVQTENNIIISESMRG